MKWRNKSEADVIPSRIANVRWPHLVIRYYEQRIRWIDV
ncbi:chromobox protein 1-like protein [Dinothrombium tinctorium]|uniref:Chromobox protein 1-like protein n=1 Tax=Dinothrombium tinctorium TaxID=1965070 RepID=A0A3S3RXZ7_9ACAR|nr:chromobox protein 1-like protein [Dinothrombium tinctorium]